MPAAAAEDGTPGASLRPRRLRRLSSIKPRLVSDPAHGAAGSQVPSPLRLLHILFVQKPKQESKEEALVTQRLGWDLPGPVGSGGCGGLG